jgi:hypothetical protein
MVYTVVWSEEVLGDIDALADYIARDSIFYAQQVVDAAHVIQKHHPNRLLTVRFDKRHLKRLESVWKSVAIQTNLFSVSLTSFYLS